MTNERKADRQRAVHSFVPNPTTPFRTKPGDAGYRSVPRRLRTRRRIIKALKRISSRDRARRQAA